MKPTVHDIAAHAGVSLATVDRVLNGRAGVRLVTRERVEAAVSALGFVRDQAAANLAKGRVYAFTFILPANDNSFMIGLRAEVAAAAVRASSERIQLTIVDVAAFDVPALVSALDAAAFDRPDGVAFVAVDAAAVRAAADRLVQAQVPVVTLVSDLGGSSRAHYAGIDNAAAGRTAATLIGRFLGGRRGPVLPLAGSLMVRDHAERLAGFSTVMRDTFPQQQILPVVEGRDDPAEAERLVTRALHEVPQLAGIYSCGAGNRGLIRAIAQVPANGRPVVVLHELTEATRTALIDGMVDAVLNQDAGHEVRSAIRVLKAKADGSPVVAAQERIRIDIFLKDNLP
jgi:LacI family transcriptional regulator